MNMVYQNNNLYIDLEGDIDDELLLKKLKNIKENYNVEDIVINKKLYYTKDELIDKIITKNGIAFSKSIPIGTYYAKELKTIEGYIIDETNHYFEVKNEDTIIIN